MTKTLVKTNMTRAWSYVRFMIGFHRDPKGVKRETARVWSPPDGNATIRDDITDAEVFCHVTSASGDADMDVQIKLHPDKIVLRRNAQDHWSGVVVSEHDVQVKVGDIWVRVSHDGTVTRKTDIDTTHVDPDGSVFKETLFSTASMSADGTELSSNTAAQVSKVTPSGVVQYQKPTSD